MSRVHGLGICLGAALVLSLVAAEPANSAREDLPTALAAKAPRILEQLKEKGFKNVGVLKFLVKIGDAPAKDDVGELNANLANQCEVALVLANLDESFGIIPNPSETVLREKMTSANHLDLDGRKAFFSRKYELAWGDGKCDASGFLTATATFARDLKTFTLQFQAFDKSGELFAIPGEVTIATDPRLLAEAGYSYTIAESQRKKLNESNATRDVVQAVVDGAEQQTKSTESARKEGKSFAPLEESPIRWSVLLNGKAVAVKGDHIPEPKENDKIEFVLNNPTEETYGVVLLVNGENTLFHERTAVAQCRKWILEPKSTVTVRGFQSDADTVLPFKVLSPEESDEGTVNYGPHAGTFRMVVFSGKIRDGDEPAPEKESGDSNLLAIARTRGTATPGKVKPLSLKALQADLRGRSKSADGSRGLVGAGAGTEKSGVKRVVFQLTSEMPVADVSLRYLAPKK